MRDSAVRVKTTSFSASATASACAGAARRRAAASCARRAWRGRRARRRARRYISGRVISVRKPREPKLTPRIGTSRPLRRCGRPSPAACRRRRARARDRPRPAVSSRVDDLARGAGGSSAAASVVHTASTPRARSHASSSTSVSRGRVRPGLATMPMRISVGAFGAAIAGVTVAGRRCMQELRLPSAPVIGDVDQRDARQSYFSRRRRHLGDDAGVHRRIGDEPPLPTSSRPASNCGFTSATTSASAASSAGSTGKMWRSEMNETSMVTIPDRRAEVRQRRAASGGAR